VSNDFKHRHQALAVIGWGFFIWEIMKFHCSSCSKFLGEIIEARMHSNVVFTCAACHARLTGNRLPPGFEKVFNVDRLR